MLGWIQIRVIGLEDDSEQSWVFLRYELQHQQLEDIEVSEFVECCEQNELESCQHCWIRDARGKSQSILRMIRTYRWEVPAVFGVL